jgi:predicted GNAT family acetyltransferase
LKFINRNIFHYLKTSNFLIEMELSVVNVASKKRYKTIVDGFTAYIEYIKPQNKIYLTNTEMPKSMEGKGIGSAPILKALDNLDLQNLTMASLCPFKALYFNKHPKWKKLAMKGVNIEQ